MTAGARALARGRTLALSISDVAIAAFFLLVALPRAAIPLIDGDVWWHLRAGEAVLDRGSVPDTDTWTIVGQGLEWTSQDWLTNTTMAAVARVGEWGPTLLSILFSLLVVSALAILWRGVGARDATIGWLARIVWLVAGLVVAGPVVGVRVQVVDLPLAAVSLAVAWSYLAHRRRAVLLWLPLIAAAWANIHAGWPLLFLLAGAVGVGEALDRLAGRVLGNGPLTWAEQGWLWAALVASALALSMNPNGPQLYTYPLETSGIAAHRDFLAEWAPPDIRSFPGQVFAAFLLLGVLPTLVLGWRRLRTGDLLILLGLTIMAAGAARFLLIAGPIGAAIVAMGLAPWISQTRVGRAAGSLLGRMERRPTSVQELVNLGLVGLLTLAGLAVTLARTSSPAQAEAVSQHMPVAAVDWIVANDPGDRPFNTYSWGGYLGWRRPDTLVYIDGRSDIYGDGPIRAYADAISLRTDPRALLDQYAIDHVLFNTDHVFAEWLNDSPEWERAYSDERASVWVRVP